MPIERRRWSFRGLIDCRCLNPDPRKLLGWARLALRACLRSGNGNKEQILERSASEICPSDGNAGTMTTRVDHTDLPGIALVGL